MSPQLKKKKKKKKFSCAFAPLGPGFIHTYTYMNIFIIVNILKDTFLSNMFKRNKKAYFFAFLPVLFFDFVQFQTIFLTLSQVTWATEAVPANVAGSSVRNCWHIFLVGALPDSIVSLKWLKTKFLNSSGYCLRPSDFLDTLLFLKEKKKFDKTSPSPYLLQPIY